MSVKIVCDACGRNSLHTIDSSKAVTVFDGYLAYYMDALRLDFCNWGCIATFAFKKAAADGVPAHVPTA